MNEKEIVMNNTCIICGEPFSDRSVEHVLPDALGGNKTILSVCRKCNSLLGEKVDCLLTEDTAIRFLRAKFGIKNRDGKTIDLFSSIDFKNEGGERAVIKRGDGINIPAYYTGNAKPEVSITEHDGKNHVSFSGMDINSVIKRIRRETVARGIILADKQITEKVRSSGKMTFSSELLSGEISFCTQNYIPCVIKIAFEGMVDYSLLYLKDPLGLLYKEYLYSLSRGITGIIPPEQPIINCDLFTAENSHSFRIRRDGDEIYADIYLFSSLQFHLCLSHKASDYPLEDAESIEIQLT